MEATLAAELALGLPDLEATTLALLAAEERLAEAESAAEAALAETEEAELLLKDRMVDQHNERKYGGCFGHAYMAE